MIDGQEGSKSDWMYDVAALLSSAYRRAKNSLTAVDACAAFWYLGEEGYCAYSERSPVDVSIQRKIVLMSYTRYGRPWRNHKKRHRAFHQ